MSAPSGYSLRLTAAVPCVVAARSGSSYSISTCSTVLWRLSFYREGNGCALFGGFISPYIWGN